MYCKRYIWLSFAKIFMLVYISIDIKAIIILQNPSLEWNLVIRERVCGLCFRYDFKLYGYSFGNTFNFITLSQGGVQKQTRLSQEIRAGSLIKYAVTF